MQRTTVFFRDDDVGEMTDPLRRVFDVLLEAEVPCHYEVVPAYLDDRAAEALRGLQREHKDLVFLDQHGHRHEQYLGGERRASEFDGARPFDEQLEAIRAGRELLAEALGESFVGDVFTPPCHKYDAATLRALDALGFRVLSAGVHATWPASVYYGVGRALGRVRLLGRRVSYHGRRLPTARLVEVSVTIDVHEDVDAAGRRIDKTEDQLWQEFEAARRRLDVVGVMLHHQACDTPEKALALKRFVERLRSDPSVAFSRIGELAEGVR